MLGTVSRHNLTDGILFRDPGDFEGIEDAPLIQAWIRQPHCGCPFPNVEEKQMQSAMCCIRVRRIVHMDEGRISSGPVFIVRRSPLTLCSAMQLSRNACAMNSTIARSVTTRFRISTLLVLQLSASIKVMQMHGESHCLTQRADGSPHN